MRLHRLLLAGVCTAAAFGGMAVPATASAEVNVYLRVPPPPVRYEVRPAPRRGYVWIAGYWDVRYNRPHWRAGHWERARAGYHYAPATWVQRNNRWELQRGGWRRGDRDRDGIPNRYDRDIDGDGVANRYDRDRDGDGIANRYDRNDGQTDRRNDRDRDGIPNRYDSDRDGDGVPNRRDDEPNNPRRR